MSSTRSTTRRWAWSRRIALLGGATGLLLAAATPVDTRAARAVIDQTVAEVLLVLNDEALSIDERRAGIETIAEQRFDFDTMARLVMARNWRRLNPAQQADFVVQFREHLSRNYGGRIERYEQESVEVLSERLEPRGDVTVKTRIVGGEADGVEVVYRLRGRDAPWRIIDVVIEGVSLVSSFRSQFQEVMERDGPQGLLDRLREKNQTQDGAAPAPTPPTRKAGETAPEA